MRPPIAITFAVLAFTLLSSAQSDPTIFKSEVSGAFVWEEHSPSAAMTSTTDPVTGNAIHKLNHGGIEASSQAGFERIAWDESGEFLSFTTTIANNTDSAAFVRQGRASVDGHVVIPLLIVLPKKGSSKKEDNHATDLTKMRCFANGFLSSENYFSPAASAKVLTVAPRQSLTVSFVAKDPRERSASCSMQGCHPKGNIRFSVTVNTTDFVFVWPGRTMVDCGQ